MAKILVVEDDHSVAQSIEEFLKAEQHTVDVVHDGQDALERLDVFHYDAMVLDWNLPRLNGIDVCKATRAGGSSMLIIMLTGKTDLDARLTGLDTGADDYMTKPFHPSELAARVRALLRRPAMVQDEVLKKGDLVVNTHTRKVTKAEKEVALQPMEYKLLEFFLRHPDRLFSSEALLRRCWSDEADISLDAIYTCIRRLRKKLDMEKDTSIIRTVHSVGYILDSEDQK
ncbi:MAG: response regulator transcription factor [Candidatus Obscuribacterales bacterium]|nr:response regulator transcription factor [Candidatus Obscuribacterales bacterium]